MALAELRNGVRHHLDRGFGSLLEHVVTGLLVATVTNHLIHKITPI
jgi:hypothetical protein